MKCVPYFILILLTLSVEASATEESSKGSPSDFWSQVELRPELTFSLVNPTEFNSSSVLGADQAMRLSGAPGFYLSAQYPLLDWMSVGVQLDYLRASSADVETATVSYNAALNALVPYASITFHHPLSTGWSVGSTAGVGVAALYWMTIQSASDSAGESGSNTFAANPVSAFATVYCEYHWNERFLFRAELGNRFLIAHQLQAIDDGPLGVHQGDPLRDEEGHALTINASSPYFGLGVTMRL